jgi:hypothetical protein
MMYIKNSRFPSSFVGIRLTEERKEDSKRINGHSLNYEGMS